MGWSCTLYSVHYSAHFKLQCTAYTNSVQYTYTRHAAVAHHPKAQFLEEGDDTALPEICQGNNAASTVQELLL